MLFEGIFAYAVYSSGRSEPSAACVPAAARSGMFMKFLSALHEKRNMPVKRACTCAQTHTSSRECVIITRFER